MNELLNFIKEGQAFIIPALVLIITQIIKVALEWPKNKKIVFSDFSRYGGMPSSHTALFVSLSTIIFLVSGWHTPVFAVSVIICIIMVRDALGIRHHLGNHGLILKQLIEEQAEFHNCRIKHEKIATKLGHTPLQVIVGGLVGFYLTILFYLILN